MKARSLQGHSVADRGCARPEYTGMGRKESSTLISDQGLHSARARLLGRMDQKILSAGEPARRGKAFDKRSPKLPDGGRCRKINVYLLQIAADARQGCVYRHRGRHLQAEEHAAGAGDPIAYAANRWVNGVSSRTLVKGILSIHRECVYAPDYSKSP